MQHAFLSIMLHNRRSEEAAGGKLQEEAAGVMVAGVMLQQ
jgi:hypothetical protein